jgi:hypothetical protein
MAFLFSFVFFLVLTVVIVGVFTLSLVLDVGRGQLAFGIFRQTQNPATGEDLLGLRYRPGLILRGRRMLEAD